MWTGYSRWYSPVLLLPSWPVRSPSAPKTQAYFAYSFLIGAIIYPLYGHWVWGGGWLGSLEAIGLPAAADYAGSGVVHAVGGFVALAGAAVVGARTGKFNADGSANDLRGHNVPYVIIGTFILFFGWFGFNINTGDSIGLNAINTLLAGATGAVVALYIQLIRTGKTDILMACNGALAGLVGNHCPGSLRCTLGRRGYWRYRRAHHDYLGDGH